MELEFKDFVFLATQVVIVTTVVVNNRLSIQYLKEQNEDHKNWIEQLQKTVADLRVKVGI